MRRRWKRRLLWAAVLFGVLLLAIPATVAQATAAVEAAYGEERSSAHGVRLQPDPAVRAQVIWLKRISVTMSSSPISRL